MKGAVIAIGNFDGVHRGHRVLLDETVARARAMGRKAGLLTFEPHPRKLFRPDDPPFRITPLPVKLRKLAETGLDFVCAPDFNWDFASQSADDFVTNILRGGLSPAHIVVGYDFRFGQLRKGTPAMIADAGIPVTVIEKIEENHGEPFSSSLIRQALQEGDIARANALLGWEWEMEGVVQKGDQRGRALGFPTANIALNETLHPAYGIYATRVQIADDGPDSRWYQAATNIGIRPMFEVKTGLIEAHLLDVTIDLYGKHLRVRPVAKLRGEAKFDTLDALIAQIAQDCAQTRQILSGQKPA